MQKRCCTEFSILTFLLRFTHCNPFSITVSQRTSWFSRPLLTPLCLPIFNVSFQSFCKTDRYHCCHFKCSSSRKSVKEQATKPKGLLFGATYTHAKSMASIWKVWHTHFNGNKSMRNRQIGFCKDNSCQTDLTFLRDRIMSLVETWGSKCYVSWL